MKEIFVIHLAVVVKQDGPMHFAENVSFASESREELEALAVRVNELNDTYGQLFDGFEPITLLGTPLAQNGTVDEMAIHLEDIIKNGETRFAEQTGQQIPDTASELERIRRGGK